MSDKYDQLKKNLKHLSATYSPGILVSTMDGARIALTDLQEEIKALKAITELAVKGLKQITINGARCGGMDTANFVLADIERIQNAET